MALVYLSLGSNVGDRAQQLRGAIQKLQTVGSVVSVSSLYETEPMEIADQPWFLNVAVSLETDRSPESLLADILQIETNMGRQRIQKKGPRNIDVDILLFENMVVESPGLTIPHPAMQQRRFVLSPLTEIAPEARHPLLGQTVREMLDALPPDQKVYKIGEPFIRVTDQRVMEKEDR